MADGERLLTEAYGALALVLLFVTRYAQDAVLGFERDVVRALRDPERLRGDTRPRAVEDPHRDLEPLAFAADAVKLEALMKAA